MVVESMSPTSSVGYLLEARWVSMSGLDLGIVVAYFALVMGVGVFSAKRAKTSDDYLVAGHRLGYGLSFSCLCALVLGGASTIGTTALGYEFGISGIWLVAMLGLGLVLVSVLLIRRIYDMKILTVAQLLSNRFGDKAGTISAIVSALYTMLVCATQIIAMGTILQGLAGWDSTLSMLVVGGVVVVYTILGGMWAITLTDFVQFILKVVGVMVIMLPAALSAAGGWGNLQSTLPSFYWDPTAIGWLAIIQYFFLYCLGAMVGQDIWQRFLTARSVKVARRSGIFAGVFALAYALTCALIGMCAQVIAPGMNDSQLAFATIAGDVLPQGLLGVVLASVLAVLMSTASGTLLASSSLLTNDVIRPLFMKHATKSGEERAVAFDEKALRTSKQTTAVVGVVAILVAVSLNNIIAALDASYAILSGALFFPIILGIFWKRATPRAAIMSIVCSSAVIVVGLAICGTTAIAPIVWGLVVSVVLMVGITLFDSRKLAADPAK